MRAAFLVMGLIAALLTPAHGADKVTFATNWLAEPEHGGFYQALADGTYARHGLDVTIQQGGPQANGRLLLAAGRIQFYMGAYDGNPANLNPLPPQESAKRYLELLGGADKAVAAAQAAYDKGDFRWAAELLNHAVFGAPDNKADDLKGRAKEATGAAGVPLPARRSPAMPRPTERTERPMRRLWQTIKTRLRPV